MLRAVANPLASGALPSNVTSASLNSITPTGGTLNVFGAVTLSGGTANSVAYLNASKEVTTSSDLFFDGSTFRVAGDIAAVGNGARFSIYRDTGINYLDWADGQDLYLSTQTSSGGSDRSTKAVFGTDGSLLIGQTTNPNRYKLAVAGDVGVTGSISATTRVNYPSFTVATLPAVGSAGGNIYVSDESGGAQPAFSDGTNWRRYTDRAVVS